MAGHHEKKSLPISRGHPDKLFSSFQLKLESAISFGWSVCLFSSREKGQGKREGIGHS